MVEVQSVNPRGGKQFTHRNLNPFRAHPNDNRSSRQYFLSEDSEDISISEEELCCICKMSTPDAARNSTSLIFVKWLQCYKCRHWVQINYYICTLISEWSGLVITMNVLTANRVELRIF